MASTDSDSDDQRDMACLASGDDRALERLMDRHGPGVLRLFTQMLGNPDDARELAQETFARVYRHRDRFRPQARFTAWLFTIAANLARNHLRWRARHPNVSLDAVDGEDEQPLVARLPASTPSPHEVAAQGDRQRAVSAALADLPDNMREALLLCVWEDLSVAEAAQALECTPKAVESLLYRARQALRARLQRADFLPGTR